MNSLADNAGSAVLVAKAALAIVAKSQECPGACMNISPISSTAVLPTSTATAPSVAPSIAPSAGGSFSSVLERLRGREGAGIDVFGVQTHRELTALQQDALSGKTIQARDLLLYQVKAGEFNVRLELVSKLAESASATVKKLQAQP